MINTTNGEVMSAFKDTTMPGIPEWTMDFKNGVLFDSYGMIYLGLIIISQPLMVKRCQNQCYSCYEIQFK
ncbi:UNKNOWN [Stylonychia lemnae]|uniref:Uncharacterized protein n=1 Tax=Stylonychia lemnae TaxID=5949 RepID=A0A078AD62_STYLE|nr:UNKNOWN [Stylonychia lemnae]|eukprot:CDW80175.1 UNKNOWN [Stylonychia lemnae]